MSIKVNSAAVFAFIIVSILLLVTYSRGFATVDGVYHRVQSGETVWQISYVYGVSIETIKKANRLSSSMKIKAGEYLLIPGVERTVKIEPLSRQMKYILEWGTSTRWKYVVIHHSATDKGNARVFDRNHRRKRHFQHGLGYHFVICNGTYGRKDGQLEVGKRWRYQTDGAHCRAGDGNRIGIGICLVGNFNKTRPTRKQIDALVHLVPHLCYRYNIPMENVRGHGDMPGASTECPGKNFPWKRIRAALRERGCK